MKIVLVNPRGFCAGVNRAIDIINTALNIYEPPLYVRHEIVHNHHVVNDFMNRGVVFIEDLREAPDASTIIFSAHGTDPKILEEAKSRSLNIIDAVCPLVTKVHMQIAKAVKESKKIIYIGHKGHQEVIGALGYAAADRIFLIEDFLDVERLPEKLRQEKVVVCTQTTLSVDDTKSIVEALKSRFSQIEFPKAEDICYATQNRQDAVKELVKEVDHVLIIGSPNSSNTRRLLELALKSGLDAELVSNPLEYEVTEELKNKTIGISSGASAPESLVEDLIKKLLGENYDPQLVRTLNVKEEKIVFPNPKI
jgi:4-hydroxy-3-methylbut-2-en-1-yl diphosphate reductase